jgi:hypothetical protein
MRFYFSLAYNHLAYKEKTIKFLIDNKLKYSEKVGIIEFDLIMRYANGKFNEELKVNDSNSFNE